MVTYIYYSFFLDQDYENSVSSSKYNLIPWGYEITRLINNYIIYVRYFYFKYFVYICLFLEKSHHSRDPEHANGGTLKNHLRTNTMTFKWESQLNFAKEIAPGYIIIKLIIHGDIVSILVFHSSKELVLLYNVIKYVLF